MGLRSALGRRMPLRSVRRYRRSSRSRWSRRIERNGLRSRLKTMTEAVATIQGRKLDARYTLLDKLGAGGQGEVWRAHDGTRGIDIALKVLNASAHQAEAWSALEHEYAIASRLDHPSILKVFPPERS